MGRGEESGTVVTWHPQRGFGFIRPSGDGEDIFLHATVFVCGHPVLFLLNNLFIISTFLFFEIYNMLATKMLANLNFAQESMFSGDDLYHVVSFLLFLVAFCSLSNVLIGAMVFKMWATRTNVIIHVFPNYDHDFYNPEHPCKNISNYNLTHKVFIFCFQKEQTVMQTPFIFSFANRHILMFPYLNGIIP